MSFKRYSWRKSATQRPDFSRHRDRDFPRFDADRPTDVRAYDFGWVVAMSLARRPESSETFPSMTVAGLPTKLRGDLGGSCGHIRPVRHALT
jgi:hypothetical protein